MRAVVWHGKKDVRVEEVPDPVIARWPCRPCRVGPTG